MPSEMPSDNTKSRCSLICKLVNNPVSMFVITISIISSIQWFSIKFLATNCSKDGFMGFLYNFMSLGSPICMFINSIQYHISTYYITIWASAAASILTYFLGSRFT